MSGRRRELNPWALATRRERRAEASKKEWAWNYGASRREERQNGETPGAPSSEDEEKPQTKVPSLHSPAHQPLSPRPVHNAVAFLAVDMDGPRR